jgi:hypothetical protein
MRVQSILVTHSTFTRGTRTQFRTSERTLPTLQDNYSLGTKQRHLCLNTSSHFLQNTASCSYMCKSLPRYLAVLTHLLCLMDIDAPYLLPMYYGQLSSALPAVKFTASGPYTRWRYNFTDSDRRAMQVCGRNQG